MEETLALTPPLQPSYVTRRADRCRGGGVETSDLDSACKCVCVCFRVFACRSSAGDERQRLSEGSLDPAQEYHL